MSLNIFTDPHLWDAEPWSNLYLLITFDSCIVCMVGHATGGENSDQVLILFKTVELRFMWGSHGLNPWLQY